MKELIFNVTQDEDGGYVAVAVGETIVTQGDTWEELCYMVADATKGYFYDSTPPEQIGFSFIRNSFWQLHEGSAQCLWS